MKKMLQLFDKFPRQILVTRKRVETKADMLRKINKNNGFQRVFVSVYNYTGNNSFDDLNLDLDKIWFDLDSKQSLDNLMKFHNWCMEKNYKHIMFFSGKGFHIYILTKDYNKIDNKRSTLRNIHRHIAKTLGLSIGSSETSDIDEHIIGDVARLVTVPGTFNTKRRRYCICVTEEDLKEGIDFIREKAKKQINKYTYYGKNYLPINEYNVKSSEYEEEVMEVSDKLKKIIASDELLTNIPPCIKSWLHASKNRNKKKLWDGWIGWKRRGWIFMWLRDLGLWRKEINEGMPAMLSETIGIAKKYFSENEFIHSCTKNKAPNIEEFGEEQPQYLYRPYVRERNGFPSCQTIKLNGDCPIKGLCKERKLFEKK